MTKSFELTNNCELHIADSFIHIYHSGGMSSICYKNNSTLKALGECIKSFTKEDNGKWLSNWEHGMCISFEVDETGDHANFCISCGYASFWLAMKKSEIQNLGQFFIDNG